MRGEPILGEHWIEVDLERICAPMKVLIDWETAFSDNWVVEVRCFFKTQIIISFIFIFMTLYHIALL